MLAMIRVHNGLQRGQRWALGTGAIVNGLGLTRRFYRRVVTLAIGGKVESECIIYT